MQWYTNVYSSSDFWIFQCLIWLKILRESFCWLQSFIRNNVEEMLQGWVYLDLLFIEFHGKINVAWRAFCFAQGWQGRKGAASGEAGPYDRAVAGFEWKFISTNQNDWWVEAYAVGSWRPDRKTSEEECRFEEVVEKFLIGYFHQLIIHLIINY